MSSVELTGLPGAGKSTALDLATPRLKDAGLKVLRHATRAPLPPADWTADWWQEAMYHSRWAEEEPRLVNLFRRTGWRAGKAGVHPEGMVHLAWRAAWPSGCDPTDLLAAIPLCDLVVHVLVDLDIAAQRVAGKQGDIGPINRRLRCAGLDVWLDAAHTYEQVMKRVASRTAVVTISNNGDDPVVASDHLVDAILSSPIVRR
jgi:hypothetical protein